MKQKDGDLKASLGYTAISFLKNRKKKKKERKNTLII
jgi:hypothetical protein